MSDSIKEWIRLVAAIIAGVAVLALSIYAVIVRFSHPELTETQLFLTLLPYVGFVFLLGVIAAVIQTLTE